MSDFYWNRERIRQAVEKGCLSLEGYRITDLSRWLDLDIRTVKSHIEAILKEQPVRKE